MIFISSLWRTRKNLNVLSNSLHLQLYDCFQIAVFQECTCSGAQLNIPMQTLFVDTTANQNGLSMIVITRDPTIWMNWVSNKEKVAGFLSLGYVIIWPITKCSFKSFMAHLTGDLFIILTHRRYSAIKYNRSLWSFFLIQIVTGNLYHFLSRACTKLQMLCFNTLKLCCLYYRKGTESSIVASWGI